MRYATTLVNTNDHLDSLAYCNLIQDHESLEAIQEMLNDADITAAIFDTSNGDYDDLHIQYGQPSFQSHKVWNKVIAYVSTDKYLKDMLPHGSGINDNWSIGYTDISKQGLNFYNAEKSRKIIAYNKFDIEEYGMHQGTVDFKVYITMMKESELNANYRIDKITFPYNRKFKVVTDYGTVNVLPTLRDSLYDMIGEYI